MIKANLPQGVMGYIQITGRHNNYTGDDLKRRVREGRRGRLEFWLKRKFL